MPTAEIPKGFTLVQASLPHGVGEVVVALTVSKRRVPCSFEPSSKHWCCHFTGRLLPEEVVAWKKPSPSFLNALAIAESST